MNFFSSKTPLAGPIVLAALITGLFTDAASAKKPKPKTHVKFATVAPEGSLWMNVLRSLDDEVRAETENRVGFKFYPGGVQGDEKDVLRKIRNGQLHGGGFTGFGLGTIASEFRALEVPFMYRNLDEVDYVRDKMEPYFREVFQEKGYRLLGWGDAGFVYLYSNHPITNPDELRQAKIWTWSGDKLAEIFFNAFNVSPIPLPLPDVLTSLQMGVVNAVYGPPLAIIALQWFTRVKYMSDVPITYGFGAMLIAEKMVKKMSPEDAATLERLTRKHGNDLIAKTRRENVNSIDIMKGEGIEVLTMDPAVREEFFTTGRTAWKDGIGKLYPTELLEQVSAAVDEYRRNHEEARQ